MKSFVLSLSLLASIASFGINNAKYPLAFKELNGPRFGLNEPVVSHEFSEANAALKAKYSIEPGFVGTELGKGDVLLVLASSQKAIRTIWNKMLRNGDASQQNGIAYFHYTTNVNPLTPKPSFEYFASVTLDQGSAFYFRFPGRALNVRNYKLRMHRDCSIRNSSVVTYPEGTFVQPTRLIGNEVQGRSVLSTFTVNDGEGASLSGVTVTLAPPPTIFLTTNCQVDLYLEYMN